MEQQFEKAARLKLRFETDKGSLTLEQLYDLPLTSKTGRLNLDDIARGIYRKLKEASEVQSFVDDAENGETGILQLKMDLVKHVIDTLKAENQRAAEAKDRADQKQELLALINRKKGEQLEGLSLEELEAKVRSLS